MENLIVKEKRKKTNNNNTMSCTGRPAKDLALDNLKVCKNIVTERINGIPVQAYLVDEATIFGPSVNQTITTVGGTTIVNTCGVSDMLVGKTTAQNTALGVGALPEEPTVSGATAIGNNALSTATAGADNNTAVGSNAGTAVVSGASNTIVGANANVDAAGRTGTVVLGEAATSSADNQFTLRLGSGNTLRTSLAFGGVPGVITNSLEVLINGTFFVIPLSPFVS